MLKRSIKRSKSVKYYSLENTRSVEYYHETANLDFKQRIVDLIVDKTQRLSALKTFILQNKDDPTKTAAVKTMSNMLESEIQKIKVKLDFC